MKRISYYLLLTLVTGLLYTQCSKKEDPKPIDLSKPAAPAADAGNATPFQSRSTVSSTATTVEKTVTDLNNSESVKALNTLSTMQSISLRMSSLRLAPGEVVSLQILKQIKFTNIIASAARVDPQSASYFGLATGTYTYNPNTESMDYTVGLDKIVMIFPDSANHAKGTDGKNNCTLTISELQMQVTVNDTMPTRLKANLTIDGKETMMIDFTASYSDISGLPLSAEATIVISPLRLVEKFKTDEKTYVQGSAIFDDIVTKEKIMGVDARMEGRDLMNDDITKMSGFVFLGELALEGSIDFTKLPNMEEDLSPNEEITPPTQAQLDEAVKLKFKNYKSGLVYCTVHMSADTGKLFVRYSDGTTEPLEAFLEPLAEYADSFSGVLGEDLNF